jgi:ATP-dependent DNA helicase RecG
MSLAADDSLRFCHGVGPVRSEHLAAAGITTVWDALHRIPRCLAPAPAAAGPGDLTGGTAAQVVARVLRVGGVQRFGRRQRFVANLVRHDGGTLQARFWRAGYLRDHLVPGEWYRFEGRTDPRQRNVLNHPSFTHLATGPTEAGPRTGCDVAYPAPGPGLGERWFGRLVGLLLERGLAAMADPLGELAPAAYQELLRHAHRPVDPAQHETARRALAYRELAALAWLLQSRRRHLQAAPGRAWRWTEAIHARALARLPFPLTPGQVAALDEIRTDARSPLPMYRLLHGDVGSGKTALALIAALAVIADGAQVLLLAPTAVLAEQHHRFCAACLAGSRVRRGLLTGGTPAAERRRLLEDLAAGTLDLLIGTHALLEEDVRVRELGLAVIDEQHKFGVEQRVRLVRKAAGGQDYQPDLLLLTATPIPRTLALSLFGDLAISTITGLPPGRGRVTTATLATDRIAAVADHIAAALTAGGAVFVIVPLREESDRVDARDAPGVQRELAERFPDRRVLLLHGAMREADKLDTMHAFAHGEADLLVSTTVVEVGVDVARANLMVVLDADRFGLAQLHQLRGRVGRGPLPGTCLLVHRRGRGEERIRQLVEHADGLAVAEADLRQRGPGEFLGTRQHGLPELRIADLVTDTDLLQRAHAVIRQRLASGGSVAPALAAFLPAASRAELLAGG